MVLTYAEYDALEAAAIEMELSDDYLFPTLEEIASYTDDKEGVKRILIAYVNTTDAEYRRQIRAILYESIYLVDEADTESQGVALKISPKKLQEMTQVVSHMDYQPIAYFPDRKKILQVGNSEDQKEEDIAYLMWLCRAHDLSESEKETMLLIKSRLQQVVLKGR